jgi:ATP-binding cassette, subfamily B, multidrug efflux pump
MKHLRWIWSFWQPNRKWLWVLLLLTLMSSAVTFAYPLLFKYLIDALNEALKTAHPENAKTVTWNLVGMAAAIGITRSLAYLYPGFRAMLNARLEMAIREHYFGRIIDKGFRFFQKFRTGDLITRLTDDIGGFPKIAWFSCSGIFRAVESFSKFLVCIIIMLTINWKLALLSVSPLPIMLTIFYFLRTEIGKRAMQRQQIISKTNDALEASFSGVRILKAFRGESNQAREFRRILEERVGVEIRLLKLWMGMMNLYWAIQFAGQIIVVLIGGIMVVNGELTLGSFYAFYIYLSLFLMPIMDIPHLFITSRQAFACIDREIEIDETSGGTENIYTGSTPVLTIDSVELKNVDFSFNDDDRKALSGITIILKKGERAAIVGSVGSGKTTLIKLIAGIIPPTSGEVIVNGQRLSELNLTEYRTRVGYIPQEATLFSESVADNVRFGREVDDEGLISSLEMARIKSEIDAMPNNVNQMLGQRGMSVSGGQKQRIAIARALAGKPDLLLMDDVTASLDAENERAFWENLAYSLPDTACLIVTHRLATARQADVIYVLTNGKIVGVGKHEELLEKCDEYRNFLTREELQAALQTG